VFTPRDRFFAELVVARGLATPDQVRANLTSTGAEEPGMLPRYLVAGRIIDEEKRVRLEEECDRWRRSCDCGSIFYALASEAACPSCGRSVTAGNLGKTNLDLGSAAPPTADSADPVPEDASALPRSRFGPYKVIDELGRGGMGVVYRATQEPIGRTVALKVLLEPRGKRRERFVREARAAARLEHPNIVSVHDVGEDEGVAYYSMELVEGRPLDRILLSERRLPVERALAILEPIARAVDHAHRHRIVHRDLKPGNILITPAGKPVLIDFGLARALDEDDRRLTRTGVAIGTPHYMSPEQVRGIRGEIDERTDVWALGVILYELLSGERPFKGETAEDLYAAIQLRDAVSLRKLVPGVPASVEAIVAKALERTKEERYASALDLADELARAARGEAPSAMDPGERLSRSVRRARRMLETLSLAFLALASMAGAALVVKTALARRDRDQLAALEQGERERVQKLAEELEVKARARAAAALREDDPRASWAAAAEAVASLSSLEPTLAAGLSTEAGRAEARLCGASPEAQAALREALVARARVLLRGRSEDALELAESDIRRARGGSLDDPELAALHASTLAALDRPEDAERALAPALAAHPDEALLLLRQGEARLSRDAAGGLAAIESAVAARPEPAFKLARAKARLAAGEPARALEDLKDARDPEAILLEVEARLSLGQTAVVLLLVRERFERGGPDDQVALRAKALLARARGDDEGEERALARLIARAPDDAELLAARARARILRRDADAASDLRGASEHARSPRRRVALRIELAAFEDALGRVEDATKDLDRALSAAKDDRVARGLVHVARARRALMAVTRVPPGSYPGCGPPDCPAAADEIAAALRESPETHGLAGVRAWLAVEKAKDDHGDGEAREALRLLAGVPRDAFTASVELEARSLVHEPAPELAPAQARLEDAATDLSGELERRALEDMRFVLHAESERARIWERCFERASWAVSLAPRRAGAAAIAGGALLNLRGPDAARKYLDPARAWNMAHPTVLLWHGISSLRGSQAGRDAAHSLGSALRLSPDVFGAEAYLWRLLAEALLVAKDAAAAEVAARKALELDPAHPSSLKQLVQAAELRGDAAALTSAQAALQLAFKDGPAKAAKLHAEADLEETSAERTLSLLDEAARLSPRDASIFRSLCSARFAVGDAVGTWRAWMRSVELEPYGARFDAEEQSYVNTKRLLQLGNGDEFAADVAALQEKEPRAAEVHFLHAWVEWARTEFAGAPEGGPIDRAIADLDRALAADRHFALAWAFRGHLRALRGEVGTARSDLERAIQARTERMPIAHVYLASLDASLDDVEASDVEAALKEVDLGLKQGFQDRARLLKLPGIGKLRDDPRLRALLARMSDAPATGLGEGF